VSTDDTLSAAIDAATKAARSVAALAAELGAAASSPSMWKARKSVPPQYAVGVERAANRHESGMWVRRWHLRPDDWHRIWPELVGTDGAPPPPVADAEPQTPPAVPKPAADHAEARSSEAARRNTEQAQMLRHALITRDGPSRERRGNGSGRGGR
jgi:hypothetical protein